MATLNELITQLQTLDDDLHPNEFDPEELIGDIKDKVDAIKWQIDEWLAKAESIQLKWIDPLNDRRRALEGKAQRLKDYVAYCMARDGFEKLPGNAFGASLRKATSVETETAPGPDEAMTMPAFCKTKVTYAWDKTAIAEALKSGRELPFAKLKSSSFVVFTAAKGK